MARKIDVAWAAGLFEGEGTCCIGSGQRQPVVSLVSTDEDVVKRFVAIVGRGSVRNYRRPPNKRFWLWHVGGRDDVIAVIDLLLPHLGTRRTEAALMTLARTHEIVPRAGERTHCRRGHAFADGNNLYVHEKTGKRHCRLCRNTYRARSSEGVVT